LNADVVELIRRVDLLESDAKRSGNVTLAPDRLRGIPIDIKAKAARFENTLDAYLRDTFDETEFDPESSLSGNISYNKGNIKTFQDWLEYQNNFPTPLTQEQKLWAEVGWKDGCAAYERKKKIEIDRLWERINKIIAENYDLTTQNKDLITRNNRLKKRVEQRLDDTNFAGDTSGLRGVPVLTDPDLATTKESLINLLEAVTPETDPDHQRIEYLKQLIQYCLREYKELNVDQKC
jgi:hypothetical protein